MGQLVSNPHTITFTHNDIFSHALGFTQGYRVSQEDAHSFDHTTIEFSDHLNEFKQIDLRIFGIYDGHGGKSSSLFISKRLPINIIKEFSKTETLKFNTLQGLINHKIKNAFFKTDFDLFNHLHSATSEPSGSTAILVIIIDQVHIFSINVGDSRCILSTLNGSTKNLSFDHKPSNGGESIRINKAEGSVHFKRVNGILALSRAFGDFDFKRRRINNTNMTESFLNSSETQVTCEPDIIYHKITSQDEFLVIGCDGIFDVFTNDYIIKFIRKNLVDGYDFTEIINTLLTTGINSADQKTGVGFDNMSIYIVAIQQHKESFEQWIDRLKAQIKAERNS